MNLQADLLVLLPELILAVGAMVLLLAGAVLGSPRGTPAGSERQLPFIGWGAILLLIGAGAAVVMGPEQATAFHGAFVADGFSRFAKLLILVGAALSILLWISVVTAGRWIGYWEPKGAPVNAAQVVAN